MADAAGGSTQPSGNHLGGAVEAPGTVAVQSRRSGGPPPALPPMRLPVPKEVRLEPLTADSPSVARRTIVLTPLSSLRSNAVSPPPPASRDAAGLTLEQARRLLDDTRGSGSAPHSPVGSSSSSSSSHAGQRPITSAAAAAALLRPRPTRDETLQRRRSITSPEKVARSTRVSDVPDQPRSNSGGSTSRPSSSNDASSSDASEGVVKPRRRGSHLAAASSSTTTTQTTTASVAAARPMQRAASEGVTERHLSVNAPAASRPPTSPRAGQLVRTLSQLFKRGSIAHGADGTGATAFTSADSALSPRLRSPRDAPALQGYSWRLTAHMSWTKLWFVVREQQLEWHTTERDWQNSERLSRTATADTTSRLALPNCTVTVIADPTPSARPFVLLLSFPVVSRTLTLSVATQVELNRWVQVVTSEASTVHNPEAFPGIRLQVVREEPDDDSWKQLVASAKGWRVELSSSPVDVTFATSAAEHSEYARYMDNQPHSAWVGVLATGELFAAFIAHSAGDYTRMLVRTPLQDRLLEFALAKKDDLKLLKSLGYVELYGVARRESLRELDAIGAQNMNDITQFKFGVLLYRGGWTEAETFANCASTLDYDEFLTMLGTRVELQGFTHYAGGLETTNVAASNSGTHSLYTTHRDLEIMFHVSSWIPLTTHSTGAAAHRKRHICNDFCVIVFVEDPQMGAFVPDLIRTHFIHVYVVVWKDREASARAGTTCYRVAVLLRDGMPGFAPRLVRPPLYEKGSAFRDFLLTKLINGEKASKFAPDFRRQRGQLREWFLRNLLDDAAGNVARKK